MIMTNILITKQITDRDQIQIQIQILIEFRGSEGS
jgi:hypothetical protein